MFYLFTALLVATTVAAANTTTTNSSRTIHPVNNTNPQLRQEGATRNIYRCVYVYISESDHSWPGNGDVCLRGGQNVCNYDPTLPPVGQCQLNRGRISSQLVTNATNFWTQTFDVGVGCTGKFTVGLPAGPLNKCIPKYPGGTLNPAWSEPSNYCSTHGGKVFNTGAASSCVDYGRFTSGGQYMCPKANPHGKGFRDICASCGCFMGVKYF